MDGLLSRLGDLIQYNPAEPMLFNSGFFLFFFFFCILFYQFFLNNKRAKVFYLLLFSLFFYYKSSGYYFVLVIFSSLIDFAAAMMIDRTEKPSAKKSLLILSLATNLGLLGYFKYANFFLETVSNISMNRFDTLDIFLPVGISFFTFQSMSYTIDVYRGKLKPERNFFDFLFFVSFFPQLVAGPIVRAVDFLPQIHKPVIVTRQEMGRAVFLIMSGLFKKAVIADYISVNLVDRVFEMPLHYTGIVNLMALYGYALQIYCDFSGYSDMAIGLALMLGFKLPINFNSPYKAATITEFWRRWHISLSTWLKDYLYIPLGGNRKGKVRQYANLMVTMLLGGLWHGASWKFVVWGGIHGLALAVEKKFNIPEFINKSKAWRIAGIIITFHIACLCWVFFRAQSFSLGIDMLSQIFTYLHPEVFFQFIVGYKYVLLLMVIGFLLHFTPARYEKAAENMIVRTPALGKAFMLAFVIWIVVQVRTAGLQPFIYFQF